MTTWYDGVDITVEVAFTTDPLSGTPSWTDITADIRDIPDGMRGRTSEFTSYSPGTRTFVLDNRLRTYDPEYADGPHYGDLLPMKRIRLQATYGSVTYPRFDGYVLGWPQMFRGVGTDALVSIQAVDGSRFLENATLARSAYEAAVLADGPMAYWPLQEQNTTASARYEDVVEGRTLSWNRFDGAGISGPEVLEWAAPIGAATAVNVGWDETTTSGNVATVGILRDGGNLLPEAAFGVEFWHDLEVDTTSYASIRALQIEAKLDADTFVRSSISTQSRFWSITYSNDADNERVECAFDRVPEGLHHFAIWCDGTNMLAYVDGVAWSAVTSNALAAGTYTSTEESTGTTVHQGPVSHLAIYPAGTEPDWFAHYVNGAFAFGHPYGERSGARIERVLDEIGWPDGLRDIPTGDTVHGPYIPDRVSAMQYLRDVEAAENGLVFIAADGTVTLRDRQWLWRGSTLSPLLDDEGNPLLDDGDNPLYVEWVPTFSDEEHPSFSDIAIDASSVDALRNRVAVSYGTDGYLAVKDQASIDAYGDADEQIATPTVDKPELARQLANYRLRQSKDPRTRITRLDLNLRADPSTMFPIVLSIELGDRVNVQLTPLGVGDPVVKQLAVQGIQETITTSEWLVSLYLAPADVSAVDTPYLIVGDPVYGVIGASAGNKIPF